MSEKLDFEKEWNLLFDKQRDHRPMLKGWAPGRYLNYCKCGYRFIGDKRASQCSNCAYDDNNWNGNKKLINN